MKHKLTEKAHTKFGLFIIENYQIASWEYFFSLPESCQNALIIEFFDSVGIITEQLYIEVLKQWFPCVNGIELKPVDSRQEATSEAIEKANTIYNEN